MTDTSRSPRTIGRPTVQTTLVSFPLLAGLVAFVAALGQASMLADADSYWHLATGRWIIANRAVPTTDPFSHSMPGVAWTAHEWGSEVLMRVAYDWAGWPGMLWLAAIAFALTMAIMARFLVDRMEPQHAIVLTLVCATLMVTHLLARPHVIVWPLTVAWVGALVRAGEQRTAPPWYLLVMLVVWANLHASFTLALGFTAALAVDAVMQRETTASRVACARQWGAFFVAAIACSLINPQGIGAYEHARSVMAMTTTLAVVNEWKSADFHTFRPLLLWLLMVLGLGLTGRLRLSVARLMFVCGLLYLALKHQRYHALVGVVSPFLLATPIAAGLKSLTDSTGKDVEVLDRWFRALARPASANGILMIVALGALLAYGNTRISRPAPAAEITPARALAAFQATGTTGRVLNEYSFGGYLIFRGIPVFYDGRGDMYGDALIGEAVDALFLKHRGALEQLLATHQIGWTLLTPTTPAVQLLDYLPNWQRIYADSIAVVHVRRDLLHTAPSPVPPR